MKLRGKQKSFLRSQAHSMKPIFQIGKEGINQQWLNEVSDALEKRELIKVNILNNSLLEPAEVEEYIQENSNIQVIQKIGHVLVLFKRSNNKNYREISNQVAKI